jgi:hypothetical protein
MVTVRNSGAASGVPMLTEVIHVGLKFEVRVHGVLRHIAAIALALGMTAQVPVAVCAVSEMVTTTVSGCCVLTDAADTCCCGETAACEITPGRAAADLALIADLQTPSTTVAECYRPGVGAPTQIVTSSVRPILTFHPPNMLSRLSTIILQT